MDRHQPQRQRVPAIWVKDKSPEEVESISYVLRNNQILIQELLKILDHMEQEEFRAERDAAQYDTPNWSHKQADRNGAVRAINKVKSLFNLT